MSERKPFEVFRAADFKGHCVLFVERFAEKSPDENVVPLTSEERLADFLNAILNERGKRVYKHPGQAFSKDWVDQGDGATHEALLIGERKNR